MTHYTPPNANSCLALAPWMVGVLSLLNFACMGRIEAPSGASLDGATANSLRPQAADATSMQAEPLRAEVFAEFPSLAQATVDGLPVDVSAQSILASVQGRVYRLGFPWVKINSTPFQSAVADGTINVWVSGTGAASYATVAPDASNKPASMPPGTTIVREVISPDQTIGATTLMVKGPPGYNPDLGDFWFGVMDEAGTPVLDEATGQPRLGRLAACYGCHIPRSEQGYLFGAPQDNRMPYMTFGEAP